MKALEWPVPALCGFECAYLCFHMHCKLMQYCHRVASSASHHKLLFKLSHTRFDQNWEEVQDVQKMFDLICVCSISMVATNPENNSSQCVTSLFCSICVDLLRDCRWKETHCQFHPTYSNEGVQYILCTNCLSILFLLLVIIILHLSRLLRINVLYSSGNNTGFAHSIKLQAKCFFPRSFLSQSCFTTIDILFYFFPALTNTPISFVHCFVGK